jgi:hypothetical protein
VKKVWLLVLALVLVNAGVILAIAAAGGDGDLKSAIRASAEGEGEEEEEGGLGPAEPDDYFLFQRASGGKLPTTGDFRRAVRQAGWGGGESHAPRPRPRPPRTPHGRSKGPPTSAAGSPTWRSTRTTRTPSTWRRPAAACGRRPTAA